MRRANPLQDSVRTHRSRGRGITILASLFLVPGALVPDMRARKRMGRILALPAGVFLLSAIALVALPGVSIAAEQCGTSSGYSICLDVPDGVLTGDVSVSVTVNGSTAGIYAVDFSWGPTATDSTQLLSDFEAPYGFVWRTDKYLDATQWLNVRTRKNWA